MENVGLITYRDEFIQRDEFFTEQKKQYTRMVILHEVSHMWFGNMVTMKWWDDLWLNESFANFVSYLSLDEGEGTKHYEGAWSMFLDESFWGLTTDQKNTTHPISVEVIHTEAATDMFDGISYGKGAAWLNQILTLFGREIFKTGIATYFKEYAYQNTSLGDFIRHMHEAAIKCQSPIDFEKWSHTWLKCAGPNIIWHDVTEEAGKITKFTVQQRVHEHGTGNQLRVQKYQCAFYAADMTISKVVDIVTKDDQETFDIPELVGHDAPFAYHINYQN
jgi:aminopeptidase N